MTSTWDLTWDLEALLDAQRSLAKHGSTAGRQAMGYGAGNRIRTGDVQLGKLDAHGPRWASLAHRAIFLIPATPIWPTQAQPMPSENQTQVIPKVIPLGSGICCVCSWVTC